MEADKVRLRVENVSKSFGSLEALKPFSVELHPGEVHAVVGENGAGKSTLMNILGGFLVPSSGSVYLGDKVLPKGNPQKCRSMGIEMIHQHFKLVPAFSVEENLMLSQLGVGQKSIETIKERAKEFGWEIPWASRIGSVPVGIQQQVEILKCVATNPQVLIFDEPTAVLGPDEVKQFIAFVRRLAVEGKIVILIAHKIEEVLAASDRITVLRRGDYIGTSLRSETTADQLVERMVGGFVESSRGEKQASPSEAALAIQSLSAVDDRRREILQNVNLTIAKGEVLGVGGVDGNGQVELAECLAGVRPFAKGEIQFENKPLDFRETYVGYVPQDRQIDGLAVDLSLTDNMAIAALTNGQKFSRANQEKKATALIEEFAVKAKSAKDKAKQLSGGNQQKVVLARVLDQNPRILVVVNPTRGLDVKAAAFVHQKLRSAAAAGTIVILFTTDRDELFDISDRQVFMSRGQIYSDETEALTH